MIPQGHQQNPTHERHAAPGRRDGHGYELVASARLLLPRGRRPSHRGGAGAAELSDSDDSSAEDAGSDGEEAFAAPRPPAKSRPRPKPSRGDAGGGGDDSSLPSAVDAFAEISGPPEFLSNRVAEPEEAVEALGVLDRRGKGGGGGDSKQPPPGAVVVAKPQLVAIRERVISGTNGTDPPGSEGKRIIGAILVQKMLPIF